MKPGRTLILGYGNPARGDDALGPLLVERLEKTPLPPEITLLSEMQLQPELIFDLAERERVVFIDAGLETPPPWTFERIEPGGNATFTTHTLSPQALLQIYREVLQAEPPPSFLLTIRGERFELGTPLSPEAQEHLEQAFGFLRHWLLTDQSVV